MTQPQTNSTRGPYDPDELVRWAENYGHPEEWAKKAQDAHGKIERLRARVAELEVMLNESHEREATDVARVAELETALRRLLVAHGMADAGVPVWADEWDEAKRAHDGV